MVTDQKLIPDWHKQEPFVVVEEMLTLPWGGRRDPKERRRYLACAFCYHQFEPGESARWVAVPKGAPNIFVCLEHDGADVVERWTQRWETVVQPALNRWGSQEP